LTQTDQGTFFPWTAILVELFSRNATPAELEKILIGFGEHLPINETYKKTPCDASYTNPKLRERGFQVIHFSSYGRTLSAELGWIFPQHRSRPAPIPYVRSFIVDFKAKPDRTLGKGKWLQPMINTVPSLLQNLAKSIVANADHVLTSDGKSAAIEAFKWDSLNTMTTAQARHARVEFIRAHPELIPKPRELAAALKKANLYAQFSDTGKIVKSLPKLIGEASATHKL
jgi:hypothetical protein